jgi:hypothetical protein
LQCIVIVHNIDEQVREREEIIRFCLEYEKRSRFFERLNIVHFEIKRIQRDSDKDFDVAAAHAYLKKNKLIHFVGTIPEDQKAMLIYKDLIEQ